MCLFSVCLFVCVCVAGGRGQVKEVAPGWSVVVRHNRWKVRTYSSGPMAAPGLLIVEDAQAMAGGQVENQAALYTQQISY